jgi:hypothetical protein
MEAAACNMHAEGSQYQTSRRSDRNGQPDRQAAAVQKPKADQDIEKCPQQN